MRRLRYQVAASLDGYIAGPNGEFDWIVDDPDIDLSPLFAEFDTAVMGSKTFAVAAAQSASVLPGLEVVVYSHTLRPADHPDVTVIDSDPVQHIQALKTRTGKDIWLFGGGLLFGTLLAAGVVDSVELAVVPVLLGTGIPILSAPYFKTPLVYAKHRLYPKSGIMSLEYAILPA